MDNTAAVQNQDTSEEYVEKAKRLRVELIELNKLKLAPENAQNIPEAMARRYKMLCVGVLDNRVTLAMVDPTDIFAIDDVRLE